MNVPPQRICNANGLQELPESESELGVPLRTCELERVGTLAASVFFSRLVSKNCLLKNYPLVMTNIAMV